MSSTYVHYQAPSSLPSDYAILSRPSSSYESRSLESQPANPYPYRPLNPTIGASRLDPHSEPSHHFAQSPTETSPLLNNPPVPRIEENTNCDGSPDNTSKVVMFWEELAILTKYALPVFGYAHALSFIFHA